MKVFREFSIPIAGLTTGVYPFQFSLDKSFFQAFEERTVDEGQIEAEVELDLKPGMLVFDMRIHGTVNTICDRCLAAIDLPVSGEYQLIVKYAHEEKVEGEIVYISYDDNQFQLAPYLKELVELSLPISKVFDCDLSEPRPCDDATLAKLRGETESQSNEDGDDDENPWNVLKGIDLN